MHTDVYFTENGHILTAHLGCELDHHAARAVRERIDERLLGVRPRVLVLDLGEVEFMDSSGLGLILGRVEKAATIGAEVELCGLSPSMMKLLRLSGIERVRHLSIVK